MMKTIVKCVLPTEEQFTWAENKKKITRKTINDETKWNKKIYIYIFSYKMKTSCLMLPWIIANNEMKKKRNRKQKKCICKKEEKNKNGMNAPKGKADKRWDEQTRTKHTQKKIESKKRRQRDEKFQNRETKK